MIRVPASLAETAIKALRKLQLIDNRFELGRSNDEVVVPIIREPSEIEVSKIPVDLGRIALGKSVLLENRRRPKDLRDSVNGELSGSMLSRLPRSFDIIGDVAILELPHELDDLADIVGKGVMRLNPRVRLVLRKFGDISGVYRTRNFEVIAGTGTTETVYREFSSNLRLDVASVYFNPRLSHERMRVASQVKEQERVLDMFAGVGPYTILIAKTQLSSVVYSIDINPQAFGYLKENLLLNHVADRVLPNLGDAREVVAKSFQGIADRVIMNLPSEAVNFIDVALLALQRRGGVIHYYSFASRKDTIENVIESIRKVIEGNGRTLQSVDFAKVLKEISSNRVQVALDLYVR